MKSPLFFCLALISLVACQTDSTVSDEVILLDTHEAVKNKKDLKLSDIAKSIEFVKLETSPECLISGGRYVVGEKYIVFLNRKPEKVMLFDRSGKYLREIGRVGKGPGEFERPTYIDLSPDEDRILVESVSFPSIILEFSIDGNFIRSAELSNRSENGVYYLGNDQFIFMQGRHYTDSANYPRIVALDQDLSHPTTLYSIDHKRNPDRMAGYFTRSLFSRLKSGFNFKDSMYDTVYYVNETLRPVPKYVIVEGENTPPYFSMTREESDAYLDNVDMVDDLTDYLLLLGQVNGKRVHLAYHKTTGEFFALKKQSECLGTHSYSYGLVDDLTGMKPYWMWESADLRNNTLQELLNVIDLKDVIETDCFNNDERLIITKYRDALRVIVESSSEEDNPIIRIIHLK